MNKILLENDKIKINNQIINNNKIIFNDSDDYIVEYSNNSDIDLNIIISENININLFVVNKTNNKNIKIKYEILENSNLTINKFYHVKNINEKIDIDLKGENSKFNYYFSAISIDKQIYKLKINHLNKNTSSIVSNNIVTIKNGKVDFTIDSIVKKGNTSCLMDQSTRIITINEVNSIIRPNMFIDEYDVQAKHSSIVGTFKEEDLFYLMTRSISYDNAIKLLVKGHLFKNINKNMYVCSHILDTINKYWR